MNVGKKHSSATLQSHCSSRGYGTAGQDGVDQGAGGTLPFTAQIVAPRVGNKMLEVNDGTHSQGHVLSGVPAAPAIRVILHVQPTLQNQPAQREERGL